MMAAIRLSCVFLVFASPRICCISEAAPGVLWSSPSDPVVAGGAGIPRPLYGPLSWFGRGSTFPIDLLRPGDPFGSNPVLGSTAVLRRSISAAKRSPSKIFTIVVLGGSGAQGMYCPGSMRWLANESTVADNDILLQSLAGPVPGLNDSTHFQYWGSYRRAARLGTGRKGDVQLCSWSARLARYIGNQLLPQHQNFVVFNGAEGAVDSMYHLINARRNFAEQTRPVVSDRKVCLYFG